MINTTELLKEAYNNGFPAFINNIENSIPNNSSPYYCTINELNHIFKSTDRIRTSYIIKLRQIIELFKSTIGEPVAGLIGGSFLDIETIKPNDLDIVVFYSRNESSPSMTEGVILDLKSTAKNNHIDLSLFPLDFDPLWSIKTIGFYTHLFMSNKNSIDASKGCVLIDFNGKKEND